MSLFRNISHFLKSFFASYFCYDTQFLIHLQSNTWRYEWHLLLDEVLDVSRLYGGETPILLQVRVIIKKLNCFMFILLGCISLSRPPTRHSIPLSSRCFQRVVLWHWYCLRYAQNFFSIWSLVHRFDNKFLGFFKYLQVVPNSTIMQSSIFRATIFFVMF